RAVSDNAGGGRVGTTSSGGRCVMTINVRRQENDRSIGTLLGDATNEVRLLVRKELELAKLELKGEATHVKDSAKFVGVGAFCGYLAVVLVSFAAGWGLAEVMAAGWAFLIVGVI